MELANTTAMWQPGMSLAQIEKVVILEAFRHYRGNKTQTAQALGIAIRTLDARLDEYKVQGEDQKQKLEKQYDERAEFRRKQMWGQRGTPQGYQANGPYNEDRAEAERRAIESFDGSRQGLAAAEAPRPGEGLPSTRAGASVEPLEVASAKSAMPVHERQKVQGLPPGKTQPGRKR